MVPDMYVVMVEIVGRGGRFDVWVRGTYLENDAGLVLAGG